MFDFLPFNIPFCDVIPTLSANWEALVSEIDNNFNIRILAFSIPRIFAIFNQFTSQNVMTNLNQLMIGFTFKILDATTFYLVESTLKLNIQITLKNE